MTEREEQDCADFPGGKAANAASLSGKPLGIYIHIPFCARKCAYCDFLSAPATEETMRLYADSLKREMREAAEILRQEYVVSTVFFGGGTPSILPESVLSGILEELFCLMPVKTDAEITVECNPGTLTETKLKAYRASGVNRLSIGLQSADNRELQLLGRIHTFEEFAENYELARETGFQNLNVDLMSALPGQTREGWMETLYKVTELEPEHISAYSLIIEEGTPFYEKYKEGGPGYAALPDEDTDRLMYEDTKKILEARGYQRYEISNYARPGFACRHNLSYWERTAYKGFGLGAASLLGNRRYRNGDSLLEYLAGNFSYDSVTVLSRKEELEETMFLGLRKMEGVSLTEQMEQLYGELIVKLCRQGVLERQNSRIFLTDRGIDVSNRVLSEFLLDEEI